MAADKAEGVPSAPTIKIAADASLHPVRTVDGSKEHPHAFGLHPLSTIRTEASTSAAAAAAAGGVYNTRSRSRVRSRSRGRLDRSTSFAGPSNALGRVRTEYSVDARDVEDGDEWRHDDGRKKQVFGGTTLLWLAYQSIGVIYGDIGTSPLYVFSSTFQFVPTSEDVTEVLSLIIWSLTLMVTIKYVIIILRADNEGEGGTFSCYSLLTRYANITQRDPRDVGTVRMERHMSHTMRPSSRTLRGAIERSRFTRGLLKTIGVLAVSMVMSDGVLTPAQSVLGAVQGLTVVRPDISTATIVGTACGILVLLFLIQPLGTTRIAGAFAPIVIIWLAFNGSFGIYNLVKFDSSVLRAFSPYYAFQFFVRHKTEGWKMLGGVLLAFTGVEALFADLGAFSMRAIQLSWLCYTYPCLLLAYIGQAAYLSVHPEDYTNPFFNSVPPGMLYPSLIVAVLAAIVASQAIITATFQLISQIMKLSYCPQVKVVHTSKVFHGQVYVPFLNWLLMLGTILVTAIYSNTTRLGNAYGVCVMFVTFFDTCMVTLVALIVWRLHPALVALPWLIFACIDGLYLSSALTKVPDGAWFTLTLSAVLAGLFLLWRFGKESQWHAEAEDRFRPGNLIARERGSRQLRLTPKFGGDALSTLRGLGVFFDKAGVLTPGVFTQFVTKFGAAPEAMVFFHLHPVEEPAVAPEKRYAVSRFTAIPGCYRLVIRHGFMDEVISPDLAALVYEQVRGFVIRQALGRAAAEAAARSGTVVEAPRGDGASDDEDDLDDPKDEAIVAQVDSAPTTEDSTLESDETAVGDDAITAGVAEGGEKREGSEEGTADAKASATASPPPSGLRARIAWDASALAHPAKEAKEKAPATATLAAPASHVIPVPFPQQHHDGASITAVGGHNPLRDDKRLVEELRRLDEAYAARVMYVVGKEQMHIRTGTPLWRKGLLAVFLWIRDNTRAKIANLRLAMDRVVEVGFVKDI